MDKKLKQHHAYIESKIDSLARSKNDNTLDATITYHQDMVRNFQHERFIHLVVTFFFIAVTLALLAAYVAFIARDHDGSLRSVSACLGAIVAILAVTDLFYIRHYYRLENGVEKLYGLTEKLYKLKVKE
ncbi:MAG: hypothetical protein LBG75_02590 [Candidatus Nomurabacteria bacterium]|nr:hypothetical protein [Candidatus Nomurabacteria bacterium]